MSGFNSNDCWVLFSIGFGENGANLKEIIASADRINHAIITRIELEASVNKLINNDFVFVQNETYFATDKAKNFYNKNKRFMEGYIEEWIRISDELKKQPYKKTFENIISISDEEYRKALIEYHKYFNKSSPFLNFLFGIKD